MKGSAGERRRVGRDPLGAHRRPRQGPRGGRAPAGAACAEAGLLGLAAPTRTAARASASPSSACSSARSARAAATCPCARRWSAACSPSPAAARRSSRRRSSRGSPPATLLVAPALNEPGRRCRRDPATRLDGDRLTGRKIGVPDVRRPAGRDHAAARLRLRRDGRAGRRARRPAEPTASRARPRRARGGERGRGDLRLRRRAGARRARRRSAPRSSASIAVAGPAAPGRRARSPGRGT